MKKIVLNAGGTGGHFFPAIALGEELKKRGHQIYLITDKRCEKYLTADIKFTVKVIDLKINAGSVQNKLIALVKILFSTLKALIYLSKIRPDIIISFGGYPTIPGSTAAVLLSIPTIIHEQNSFLGKTNRFFAKFAKAVALSYPETSLGKNFHQSTVITGDIIRANIKNMVVKDNFNNLTFRILVIGGSQSAKVFSKLIPESIIELLKLDSNVKLQITQQAPENDHEAIGKVYSNLGISYKLSGFFHNIEDEYNNAELVICRAGASTIAELSSIGLPAIYIPFPYAADNHQYLNAKVLEEKGASWCMAQESTTPESLAKKLMELLSNREILRKASIELLKRKSDGAKILADTVEKIIS